MRFTEYDREGQVPVLLSVPLALLPPLPLVLVLLRVVVLLLLLLLLLWKAPTISRGSIAGGASTSTIFGLLREPTTASSAHQHISLATRRTPLFGLHGQLRF